MRMAGLWAALLLLASAGAALADDDFVAQCKKGEERDADKICACIAEKIDPADRPGALAAMRYVNDLTASGKQVTPDGMTPELRQSMRKLIQTEAQCLQ
jgi:hypothetical protein